MRFVAKLSTERWNANFHNRNDKYRNHSFGNGGYDSFKTTCKAFHLK